MAPERNSGNDKGFHIKFYEPAGPARSHRVARQQFLVDGASAAGNIIFHRYQPQSVTSQQPSDLPPPCPLAAVLSPPQAEFSSSPSPSPPPPPPPPPPTPTPRPNACPRILPLRPSLPPSPLPSPPPPLSPLPLLPLLLMPSPLPASAIGATDGLLVAAVLLGASSPSQPEGTTEEAECGDSERDFAEMWRSFIQFED